MIKSYDNIWILRTKSGVHEDYNSQYYESGKFVVKSR